CGRCSKPLSLRSLCYYFLWAVAHSEDAKFSEEVNKKPRKPVHSRVVNMEGPDSFSAECSRGDPMSISTEECVA
ncbi:hypothetical protein ABZP36_008589, partial [Zizania latifolia]